MVKWERQHLFCNYWNLKGIENRRGRFGNTIFTAKTGRDPVTTLFIPVPPTSHNQSSQEKDWSVIHQLYGFLFVIENQPQKIFFEITQFFVLSAMVHYVLHYMKLHEQALVTEYGKTPWTTTKRNRNVNQIFMRNMHVRHTYTEKWSVFV